jgi:hypothetical protein
MGISRGFFHVVSVIITFNFVAFAGFSFDAGIYLWCSALDVLNSIQQVTFDPSSGWWLKDIKMFYRYVYLDLHMALLPSKIVNFNKVIFLIKCPLFLKLLH